MPAIPTPYALPEGIHIHAPPVTDRAVTATVCPDCQRRTRMLSFFQDWYGWRSTCLRCGREWDCGEWLPLDFRRGVRADNIAKAKAHWRAITACEKAARKAKDT